MPVASTATDQLGFVQRFDIVQTHKAYWMLCADSALLLASKVNASIHDCIMCLT